MIKITVLCLRCSDQMETGFVYDKAHFDATTYLVWGDGEPKESIWTGVKASGEQRVRVNKVMRCTNCGYLEFYATRNDE